MPVALSGGVPLSGKLDGAGRWVANTALSFVVRAATVVAVAVLWAASWFRGDVSIGQMERGAAWRVLVTQFPVPLVNVLMPLFVLVWRWLPARLAYWLNTPDDPDPVNQGWNGTNKEPQVIAVRQQCGAFWARVYWLQRNCLYGWAVQWRGPRVDFDTVRYKLVGSLLTATWAGGGRYGDGMAMLRIWRLKIGSRYVVVYFGWKLWAYINSPLAKLVPNSRPEWDASKDTGGVPVLTVRFSSVDPLAG